MNPLEKRIKAYADARWPDRDLKGRIRKLSEEFLELMQAIAQEDDLNTCFEAADMAIILADICALKGQSLTVWMTTKAQILEKRLQAAASQAREAVNEELRC